VHFGLTGEDLVREKIPDADREVVFIDTLGFGHANVVVAVPQAWIDVLSMADLDDVATAFRLKHERKMRVATKYVNLTRNFLLRAWGHRLPDRGKLRCDRSRAAAGTAELIVDITTTGTTLAANGLKVIEDGVILRSQANLVRRPRSADWSSAARDSARIVLDRIAAQTRARAFREVRTRFAGCDCRAAGRGTKARFGVETPFGGPTSSGMITLHCRPSTCMSWRRCCVKRRGERFGGRTRLRFFPVPTDSTPKLEAGLPPPA